MSSRSCTRPKSKSRTSTIETEKSVLQEAVPRGGGYLEVSPDLVNSQAVCGDESKTSCNCGGDIDDDDMTVDNEWEDGEEEEELSQCDGDFNLLGNLITVVMLLASGNEPTDFQLVIAKDYLECIKNGDGNAPPNIQGLLNHIQMVTEEEEEEAEEEEEEPTKKVCVEDVEEEEEEQEDDTSDQRKK